MLQKSTNLTALPQDKIFLDTANTITRTIQVSIRMIPKPSKKNTKRCQRRGPAVLVLRLDLVAVQLAGSHGVLVGRRRPGVQNLGHPGGGAGLVNHRTHY